MSSSFSRWFLKNGFRVGLGIFILIAFLYFGQKQSLQSSFGSIVHSSKVQQELTDLSQSVEVFNRQALDEHLKKIASLTSDNPRQQTRVQTVEGLLKQEGPSESIKEKIQMTIGEMRAEESRLLEEREALSKKNIILLDLPIIIGTLFACFLIYAANRITRRDLKELIKKDEELQAYAKNLKESRDTLEMQSNLMSLTVEAMADGLIVVNPEHQYLRFNTVAQKLLGFEPQETLTSLKNLEDLPLRNPMTRELFTIDQNPLCRALQGESVTDLEMLVDLGEEAPRILSCNSQPVLNKDGAMLGAIAVLRDITARKTLETELRKAQQSALETAEMKSRFLANMSHEIRTPMNGLLGMTELLTQTDLDEKQKSYVQLITESGQSLLTIINDILDFSKIEAGKLEIEKTDFNLAYTVDRTVQLLAPKARQKSLTLLSYISPEIPETVRGDSGRIGQILVNLLSNALKFTERGKVVVRVEIVQSGLHLSEVKFTVQDTGLGINEKDLSRLFQPFTQADTSTSRKFGGTGLGLSICKQLVDLMGGRIGVRSKMGEGTEFWFTIPFEAPLATQPSAYQYFLPQTQFLIYDEDPDSAKILIDYLDHWNLPLIHLKQTSELIEVIDQAGDLSQHHMVLVRSTINPQSLEQGLKRLASRKDQPKITVVLDGDDSGDVEPLKGFGVEHFLYRPIQQMSLYNHLIQTLSDKSQVETFTSDDNSAEAEKEEEIQNEKSVRQGRILLAEDNTVNQLIAQAFLKELGHSAHTVANGKEALESLKNEEFDLVLMDCQMPEMDGFEATAEIRKRISSRIPIIALTANAMKGDEERCRKAGMNAYLSKPFHKEQLQALLQKFLPKSQPVFDSGRLEMFRGYKDDHNQDLRKTLISSYLQSAPTSIEEMPKLFSDNPDLFRRTAHTLKSSTASVGGFHLARLFEELEHESIENAIISRRLSKIDEEFQKLKSHLEKYSAEIA